GEADALQRFDGAEVPGDTVKDEERFERRHLWAFPSKREPLLQAAKRLTSERFQPFARSASSPGGWAQPKTVRPPYSCERRRSSAMKASKLGPFAVTSSARAWASRPFRALISSSRPSLALVTADLSTLMVWS